MRFLAVLLLVLAVSSASAQECYPSETQCLGTLTRDVRYGGTALEALDLYIPRAAADARPLVVFVHGGAFTGGDKRQVWPALFRLLLAEKFAVASVNYRLAPAVRYPGPMLDVARAVHFLRNRAAELRVDARRIVVSGSSAGAGIALWLGLRGGPDAAGIAGIVAINAQTTYDPEELAALFGTRRMPWFLPRFFGVEESQLFSSDPTLRKMFREASATAHLNAGDPPVVLIYITSDEPLRPGAGPGAYLHHFRFGEYFKGRGEAIGADVRLLTLPGSRPGAELFDRALIDELKRFLGIAAGTAQRPLPARKTA